MLLAIDGNSIVNRAFYGIKTLTTKEGLYTNGIYGFLNILLKIREDTKADRIAVAFDLKAPTFRHKFDPTYKANRKGMPEELAAQMPILKELLPLLGYAVVECEGYEADDIIGTLARICRENGTDCAIVTGDRDSFQLICDGTVVRLATTAHGTADAVIYDFDKIIQTYGVTPCQLIDVKALMGDSSDNISGVAGIGEKTALALIAQFGSLDGLYENINDPSIKEGVRQKLISGKESAYRSRFLATINKEVPISADIDSYKINIGDPKRAAELLARLEMHKLLEKMGLTSLSAAATPERPAVAKREFSSCEFDEALSLAKDEGALYLYCSNGFSYTVTKNRVLSVNARPNELIKSAGVPIYTYDIKSLYRRYPELISANVDVKGDLLLSAYLLNPTSKVYTPTELAGEYGVSGESYPDAAATEASLMYDLFPLLDKKLAAQGGDGILKGIELPLSRVLASMETEGFLIDREGLAAFGRDIYESLASLEEEIYSLAGEQFNVNSPKQLGEVLFETLGLPCKKKTKNGYSTNADVLESLRGMHPIIEKVLSYRQLAKLTSTYVEGLLNKISGDGRLHTTFIQTETRTGRLSSTEPNLQNIPVRTELGSRLRRFFIPADDCVLIDADYSQIELRVLADMSNDDNMRKAFIEGIDIHTLTASQVFGVENDSVDHEMRRRAKAVNFGIVYGIGAFSLAQDIGVSRAEADSYIKGYLKTYSGVDRFMKTTVENAHRDGFVETKFGRRRYIPELKSQNKMIRSFGERAAMNTPIQGTAADIIKVAMIRVYDALKNENIRGRLILQVHDELIVECKREDAAKAAIILKREMEAAANLSVPLLADTLSGENWLDAKG